jgi:hypothetical protein
MWVGGSWVGGRFEISGPIWIGFEPDWVTPGGSESGGLTTIQITADHRKAPQLILIQFVVFALLLKQQNQQTELR